MRYFKLIRFLNNALDRLLADEEERRFLDNVPPFCRQCELLGICRDRDKNRKCHHGCLILKNGKK